MLDKKLNVGDKVIILTNAGLDIIRKHSGTILKIHKNGNYKVLYDKYGYCSNFRPTGEKCGTNWKDYIREDIIEVSEYERKKI